MSASIISLSNYCLFFHLTSRAANFDSNPFSSPSIFCFPIFFLPKNKLTYFPCKLVFFSYLKCSLQHSSSKYTTWHKGSLRSRMCNPSSLITTHTCSVQHRKKILLQTKRWGVENESYPSLSLSLFFCMNTNGNLSHCIIEWKRKAKKEEEMNSVFMHI